MLGAAESEARDSLCPKAFKIGETDPIQSGVQVARGEEN